MKKFLATLLTLVMVVGTMCVAVSADEKTTVNVTVSNGAEFMLASEQIDVTDADGDGALTINDAFIIAHKLFNTEDGYGTATGDYGLYVTKLWGVENGGAYGYYLNNNSAWSLMDAIKTGDSIHAFIYTDTVAWSDAYSWFDTEAVAVEVGDEYILTLNKAGYDENWNLVTTPAAGATITVNGTATDLVTDKDGKATLTATTEGTVVISATSADDILVAPVCIVNVSKATTSTTVASDEADEVAPKTGESTNVFFSAAMLLLVACAACLYGSKREANEQ